MKTNGMQERKKEDRKLPHLSEMAENVPSVSIHLDNSKGLQRVILPITFASRATTVGLG